MKRQWKVDQSKEVGAVVIWKGDPNKLPTPWIIVLEKNYLLPHCTLAPGYHMIKKLSNLEWLEYKAKQVEL